MEFIIKSLMVMSTLLVLGSLLLILGTVVRRGLPALDLVLIISFSTSGRRPSRKIWHTFNGQFIRYPQMSCFFNLDYTEEYSREKYLQGKIG